MMHGPMYCTSHLLLPLRSPTSLAHIRYMHPRLAVHICIRGLLDMASNSCMINDTCTTLSFFFLVLCSDVFFVHDYHVCLMPYQSTRSIYVDHLDD